MQESFNEMKTYKEKNRSMNVDIGNRNVFMRIYLYLCKPTVYKPAFLMIVFFILQQFTGIYTLQMFAVSMLKVCYIQIYNMKINIVSIIFNNININVILFLY